MEKARAPWDQTLGPLSRTGRRLQGQYLDDRILVWERVIVRLGVRELLELLKLGKIKLFLLQIRSQFGHRRQDQERDQ